LPSAGEIADVAELAATPALIDLCTKEVEKEGKAELKIFGKEHTISGFNKPTEKPSDTRPPESRHSSAKTSSDSCPLGNGKVKRSGRPQRCPREYVCHPNFHTAPDVINPAYSVHKVCPVGNFPQPCNHYASVIAMNPGLYNDLVCPTTVPDDYPHATGDYNNQHKPYWRNLANARHGAACNADEWPPALFWFGENSRGPVWIRFCDGSDNQKAGRLWQRFCPHIAERETFKPEDGSNSLGQEINRGRTTITVRCTATYTRKTFHLDVPGAAPPFAVDQNDCRPAQPDDPGFALLTTDPWYALPAHDQYTQYTPRYFNNHARRDIWFDPETIVFDDGNSTRKATDEELRDQYGFIRCSDDSCSKEMEDLGIESAVHVAPSASLPATAFGTVTTSTASVTSRSFDTSKTLESQPEPTASVGLPSRTDSPLTESLRELLGRL